MPSLSNKDSIDSSPWPYAEFAKGGKLFWGAGRVACRESACDAWRSEAFTRVVLKYSFFKQK